MVQNIALFASEMCKIVWGKTPIARMMDGWFADLRSFHQSYQGDEREPRLRLERFSPRNRNAIKLSQRLIYFYVFHEKPIESLFPKNIDYSLTGWRITWFYTSLKMAAGAEIPSLQGIFCTHMPTFLCVMVQNIAHWMATAEYFKILSPVDKNNSLELRLIASNFWKNRNHGDLVHCSWHLDKKIVLWCVNL